MLRLSASLPPSQEDLRTSAGPSTASGADWLESPWLDRIVERAARQRGLAKEELPDLKQEVRIAIWQKGLGEILTAGWVFRVAAFKVADVFRRQIRERIRDRALAITGRQGWRDHEVERLLWARADGLPLPLRRYFELHYGQDLSEREIAKQLGICRSSVRWLARTCRRRFMDSV